MSLWKTEQFRPVRTATPSPDHAPQPEWLDRHPWLPILFLLLLPFLVELPLVIFGLSANPIWFNSGAVLGVHPGVLPGLPYIDPNVGFTTQALGHLAAEDWLRGVIPWWNPYSGIGLPLAGEMNPNAFFLPFVFLLLLHNGVLWLKIAMQILAGLATYALLRELKLGRLAALTGASLYALNGTFSWLPGPVAVINTIPFLPLLLYGIERARHDNGSLAIIWTGLAIAGSLLAGFPEAAYINGLLALAWAFYRFLLEKRRWRFLGRIIYGGVLGLLIASPLLLAFGDYLSATSAFSTHTFGESGVSWQAFSSFILPYVYGPEADIFGSSFLSAIWGNLGGYSGFLFVLFVFLSLQYRKERGLRYLLLAWIAVAWAKSFAIQPVMIIMNHIPFLRYAAFYRYSPPSWEMAVIILVAMTIDYIRRDVPRLRWPLFGSLALLVLAIYLAWPWRTIWGWPEAQIVKMAILMGVAVLWAIGGLVLTLLIWFCWRGERRRLALSIILLMDSAVLFMVPELSGVHPGKVDTSAIDFLRPHLGLSRFYTLGPIEPNYSAYFDIASINHNYLPVDSNWVDYIHSYLFPPITKSSGIIFWAPWYSADAGIKNFIKYFHNYEKLGVRYVITNFGQNLMPAISVPAGNSNNTPLPLFAGQSVTVKFTVPQSQTDKSELAGLTVMQGNYNSTANGKLAIQICAADHDCSSGNRPLSESTNNQPFFIPLAHSLSINPGTALTVVITHQGGNTPEAIWLWPQGSDYQQEVIGPNGPLPGKALQLSLEYMDARAQGIRKVYSDSIMNIWELPNPAPYYMILSGKCNLSEETRDTVLARCNTPATLVRKELYMPGWTATVNGNNVPVSAHKKIFQIIPLPAGNSVVRYQFAPPYAGYAWIAFSLGVTGLLWEFLQVLRKVRPSGQKTGNEVHE